MEISNLKLTNMESSESTNAEEVSTLDAEVSPRSRQTSETSEASTARKRRRTLLSDDDGDVLTEADDCEDIRRELQAVRDVIEELRATTGRVKVYHVKEIEKHMLQINSSVQRIALRNAALKGKLAECNRLESKRGRMSFAEVAKGSKVTIPPLKGQVGKKNLPRTQHTVFIRPISETGIAKEKLKETIIKAIDPVKKKLHINSMRQMRNGGMSLQMADQEGLDKVLGSEDLEKVGLKIAIPAKRRPRVIIYDMPSEIGEREGLEAIYEQNGETLGMRGLEEFQEKAKLIFKTGPRGKTEVNWVLEVAPELRNRLRKAERLFVMTRSCKVLDYISLSRCYKCQLYGHIAKHCKAVKTTCSHCAEEGHTFSECKNKEQVAKCAVCKASKRPYEHKADKKCPAYLAQVEAYKKGIDYG